MEFNEASYLVVEDESVAVCVQLSGASLARSIVISLELSNNESMYAILG